LRGGVCFSFWFEADQQIQQINPRILSRQSGVRSEDSNLSIGVCKHNDFSLFVARCFENYGAAETAMLSEAAFL